MSSSQNSGRIPNVDPPWGSRIYTIWGLRIQNWGFYFLDPPGIRVRIRVANNIQHTPWLTSDSLLTPARELLNGFLAKSV